MKKILSMLAAASFVLTLLNCSGTVTIDPPGQKTFHEDKLSSDKNFNIHIKRYANQTPKEEKLSSVKIGVSNEYEYRGFLSFGISHIPLSANVNRAYLDVVIKRSLSTNITQFPFKIDLLSLGSYVYPEHYYLYNENAQLAPRVYYQNNENKSLSSEYTHVQFDVTTHVIRALQEKFYNCQFRIMFPEGPSIPKELFELFPRDAQREPILVVESYY